MTQNSHTYLDLEIHIEARRDNHYPVIIRLGAGQDFAGQLLATSVDHWIATADPTADGQRLFAALFADPELRRAWDIACGQSSQRRIRLWFDTDAPELHMLPWELLHDGQTFLAADAATPFSRYLPSDTPWGGLVTERPIRILVAISNPADLDQYNLMSLDVAAERALLTEALGDLAPTHFRLESLEAPVTLERLERALASGPHVLHFMGHGAFGGRQRQTVLYLQDVDGNVQLVTDIQLTNMLRRQGTFPSLIFLAACQSAERSTMDTFAGFAPKLVQAGIPAVVAMQDKVAIAATRKLMPVFYEELARHGEVDRALNAARSLLLTGQSPDATTPVLLMRLKDGRLWEPLWVRTNPYRGLAAFTEADTEFFFGREKLTQVLIAQLRAYPSFLVVVGPSGSGKSSVVQAGLLPALRQGALYGSQAWEIVTVHPADLTSFRNSVRSGDHLVLVVDQFEELFQLPPEVQTRLLDELRTRIEGDYPTTVILTLRADFYGHLQRTPLREYLPAHQANVDEIAPDDLRAAVEKPAARLNVCFEAGLVDTIVDDAQQASHPLPPLQSALTQLWQQQERGVLTYAAYEAVGRVAGALGLWAENTYRHLSETDRVTAQRVFTRLTYYGETDTRQRRTLAELVPHPEEREAVHALVRRLADARLLVTDEETVEIIHDALLREWGRMREWIAAQREFFLWRQRLEAQLRIWEDKKYDDGALLRGALLAEAERWAQGQTEELNQNELAYIARSLALRQQEKAAREAQQKRELEQVQALAEEQRKRAGSETRRAAERTRFARRLGFALVITMLLFLTAVGTAWIAMQQTDKARNAESTAVAERTRAEQQAQTSLARQLGVQAQYVLDALPAKQRARVMLLALESLRRYPESIVNQIVSDELTRWPQEVARMAIEDGIYPLAFSPDGRLVVSGGDNTARVWEAATGREVAHMAHRDVGGSGSVVAVFSPDGQWVVSGSYDNTARVWEAATGREIARMTHELSVVSIVAFSPDGLWVVSGGGNTARVWEAATGREVARMTHSDAVNVAAFSPDGQWIVSSSGRNTAWVWEAATGREVARITHEDGVMTATFSPDGQWIVSGGDDNTARVWEAATGHEVARMMHEERVNAVAFSPDGRWVVSGSWDNTARVWEASTGREAARMTHEDGVTTVTFSPDGQWVLSGSVDGTARVWEALTGREMARIAHEDGVLPVAFSPDGRWVISSNGDHTMSVWDISGMLNTKATTGREVAQIVHEGAVSAIAFSPDGQLIASVSGDTMWMWEAGSGNEVTRMVHEGKINALAFSPDGRWVVSGSDDYTARVWEAATGREIRRMTYKQNVNAVAFSPDGQRVVSGGDDNIARVWEVMSGRKIAQIEQEWYVNAVAFSPNGQRVVSGGRNNYFFTGGSAWVWEAMTGREVVQVKYARVVSTVAFSPDGQWVVSSSQEDGTARVWEATTGREVARMTHEWVVYAVTFSPDGRWVVSGGDDNTARVWEAATGHEVAWMTHEDDVTTVAFSPDGQWVVSGSNDDSARVWEAATGREVARMTYDKNVTTVAFSPDGRWVVSGSADGTARVWWWQPEDMIRLACERLNRNLTREEWTQYLGDEPYRATCPNLPIPEEAQP